ncbi:MAG: adenylyltransferase/cytidyltransferase family protein [Austwickia sp.]|nr:adenylyltransferase/cytidyltransferase family protein [Austwickia sp.]MBK8436185.1 adenylyltransferase/cytidyltransferase family protein [Austwickia sp.]MBK9101866.1 adenylyltransferase/cytidyltransferase family protein [Austwickia sp.]
MSGPYWETGYVSGAFDLFHIGHLNVIMQARAHCRRLVVGVATDRVVREMKGRDPVIPLAERREIVAGLRDVDEVIVDDHVDKFDTWRELRYDVLFKGDDWQGTERARLLAERLEPVGSTIWFFPYTRHTSSTLLRSVLSSLAQTPVHLLYDDQGACPLCGATPTPGA